MLRLLETKLDSFEKLELVRAVHTRARTRSELASGLHLEKPVIDELVEELTASGMIAREADCFVLGPSAHDPAFADLLAAYDTDRLAVVSALSSIAMNRIRSYAATAFSDAFLLGKRRKDG